MRSNAGTKPLSKAEMSELKVTTQKAQEKEPQKLLEGGYTHRPRIYHQPRLVGYRTSNHRDKGQGATRPARHTTPSAGLSPWVYFQVLLGLRKSLSSSAPASAPGRRKWTRLLLPGLRGK